MFVSKKRYTNLLNELLECKFEKDATEKKLEESTAIIKALQEKEIILEVLTKKEKQLKDSVVKSGGLNDDLMNRIEVGTEKLDLLMKEVRNEEGKLKNYRQAIDEAGAKYKLEKDNVEKKLAESNEIIKVLQGNENVLEALMKKEEQLKDSVMKNGDLNDDLMNRIEVGTERLGLLTKGVSNVEKRLEDYRLILNETESKCKSTQVVQLSQLMKIRSYQLELQQISETVLKQSNTIHMKVRKNEIKLSNRLTKEIKNKKTTLLKLEAAIRNANNEYSRKESLLKEISELKKKVIFMREELQLQEVGFYKNVFHFFTTEQYKEELEFNNEKQKEMIKNKKVVYEGTTWTINGSEREGRKLANDNVKSMIRSFNIDCDNAIHNLRYSNIIATEKRIRKSFETINKFNKRSTLSIEDGYLRLKLEEMQLVYERLEFEQEEKETLRVLKEEERERKQVEKEIQEKFNELNSREKELEKQLKVLNGEYAKSKGQSDHLLPQIQEVEDNISLVHKKREEVNNRLEIGKSGYVYVISNIGAFGEDVYKIGMTRRLEPLDRIRELSAASVPFGYDIHAMILTDDAPSLENHLHNALHDNRVNMVNNRKEFFNVNINEIKQEVFSIIGKSVVFKDYPTATQYYETMAIKNAMAIVNKEASSLYYR
ncbi:DUF4041 domain-containing protein [Sporosarcina limicola]|uniref:Tetrahydromethanopterin S-methyltransferase subunit G n=1 Tax=Sporosarcina limicola TaxID=34101 RepID=A0A927RFY6_9BACL|nr:DUF4041 domain-containing protein [Sporosarcina limicola]MBE1556007.1 tetrahydromethanopterin S-methyltransferase subunit G [Sporosarcina limicola]